MMNLKKMVSILLALLLAVSTTVAFAEPVTQEEEVGSITINGVTENGTYEVYKLLDLESYSTQGAGAYSYTITEGWEKFFTSPEAAAFVTVDGNGYVTWTGSDTEKDVADFAKSALAYAKAENITPVQSSKNGEFVITDKAGKFSELELGYYLIDSSMGALCGLTTTNPDASITAKNGQPTVDKQVKEDSTNQWGTHDSADIGQTVEFRTTINVQPGAENYVLHDKMSEGLTFQKVSKVEHVVPGSDTKLVDAGLYTVKTTGLTDGCTFEVEFSPELINKLQTNDKIIVTYEAMLNRNAIIAGDGNGNESWLQFGENNTTTTSSTKTYTYGFDIVKTDSQNTLINGAEFKIYDAETGGNEVAVVKMSEGVYRRARANEPGEEIVVTNGQVRVVGFDNGTYYLEETKAPEGYNKITVRQQFIISDANLDATFNNNIFSTGSGVHVVNKTGTILPETGGIGTTLFYALGGLLVVSALVLMITRKRMGQN